MIFILIWIVNPNIALAQLEAGWRVVFAAHDSVDHYFTSVAGDKQGRLVAAGMVGARVFSTDFGRTWELPTDSFSPHMSSVAMPNHKHVFVGTVGSGLLESQDFCKTWIRRFDDQKIQYLSFADSITGYLASYDEELVYKTRDGGKSWQPCSKMIYQGTSEVAPSFVEGNGSGVVMAGSGFPIALECFISTDYGNTWTYVNTPGNVTAMYVLPSGEIVIGVTQKTNDAIYWTDNYGASWHLSESDSISRLVTAIHIPQGTYGYAVGVGGLILRTDNGGKSWVRQANDTTMYLNDVYVIDTNTCVAVGTNLVLRTETGSATGVHDDSYKIQTPSVDLMITPNPAADIATVRVPEGECLDILSVECYSMSGRVMECKLLNRSNNHVTLDTSVLPPGMYCVRVCTIHEYVNAQLEVIR